MKSIQVVAAIIYNPAQDQILIARRPDGLHMGGLWEFPGGKIEGEEPPLDALARELREELAITVGEARLHTTLDYSYPDKHVSLQFWEVHHFTGQPVGNEGQPIAWVPLAALSDYPFPPANQPVVDSLVGR